MNGSKRAAIFVFVLAGAMAANASGINGINANSMPNRISMNVTVPKQTQSASFGEKVQSGLQTAGGAVASGAAIVIECGSSACVVALPDGSGYRADLVSITLGPLDVAQGLSMRNASGGAALLGGALPGGSILSAAVSSVSHLAGGGSGAPAASYAATGRSAAPGRSAIPGTLASRTRDDGGIDVTEPLLDGDYVLTLVVQKAGSGVKDILQTQAHMAAPVRVRMRLILSVVGGVLRARQDSGENAISELK